jgi:hypothetical protein
MLMEAGEIATTAGQPKGKGWTLHYLQPKSQI